ncbi:MAG: hypothetical protein WA417_11505 [Stellaceae bacterium]
MRACGWMFTALLLLNFDIPLAKACDPSFILVNNTSWIISDVFTRETGDDGWSQEQLGEDTVLHPRHEIALRFFDVSAEHFDVKLVLDNGKQVTWGNVDLCEINTMDVYYDAQAGDFKAKWE